MPAEQNCANDSAYKSPTRKLVRFFEKSRDKWKEKCLEAKYKVKLLRNQVRYMEKRKTELKQRIKELENELGEYRRKKK